MRPEEMDQRAMGIRLLVGMLVMPPMDGDPPRRSVLETAHTENGQRVLEPFWADDAAMGQQAMEAQADPERSKNIQPEECETHTGPTEQPRHEREQCQKMTGCQPNGIDPSDTERLRRLRNRQFVALGKTEVAIDRELFGRTVGRNSQRRSSAFGFASDRHRQPQTALGQRPSGRMPESGMAERHPVQATTGAPRPRT